MGLEIERKFLVLPERWGREGVSVHIVQGYLCREVGRTVRVRVASEPPPLLLSSRCEPQASRGISTARGFLTIKSTAFREWEYEIPLAEARELLSIVEGTPIEKTRWRVEMPDGHLFEVDEFPDGLILAEIELAAPDEPFDRPPWLGREVTGRAEYYNANM